MWDRFVRIWALASELWGKKVMELDDLKTDCDKEMINLDSMIESYEQEEAKSNQGLAESSSTLSQSMLNSKNQNMERSHTVKITHDCQVECCTEQNELRGQLCALKKIRQSLHEESDGDIADCSVGEWTDAEGSSGRCSSNCSGGTKTRIREKRTDPENGAACPPLTEVISCNTHRCPVNCEQEEWSAWSRCTAECGGGVQSRDARIERRP